ncbi:MAG: phage/plasmid primase, P4 family [Thiotrichales bacterium]|nr:phage/plasmid primase, P4 family [Thiotrichales bacterium]
MAERSELPTWGEWCDAAERLNLINRAGELVGPCPSCGGEDRFHVKHSGANVALVGCRGCIDGGGTGFVDVLKVAFPIEERPRSNGAGGAPRPPPPDKDRGPLLDEPPKGDRRYLYRDADGAPLMCVVRWEATKTRPKKFSQYTREPGGWRKGLDLAGKLRPLYRLPELLAADKSRQVKVVEGEKCVKALRQFSSKVLVTTWSGGSKAWRKTDWSPLYGRPVHLIGDADSPGHECMSEIAAHLSAHCPDIQLLLPPIDPAAEEVLDIGLIIETQDRQAVKPWLVKHTKRYEPPPPPASAKAKEKTAAKSKTDKPASDQGGEPRNVVEMASMMRERLAGTFEYDAHRGWFHVTSTGLWASDPGALNLGAVVHGAIETALVTRDVSRRVRAGQVVTDLQPLLPANGGFDRDPEVIACRSGLVVNLRDGRKTHPATGADRLIRHVPVDAPEFTAEPAAFIAALRRLSPDDAHLEWLQRFLGYCLTGYTREHRFLFLEGPAGGGKSTVIECMRAIAGGYHRTVPDDVFTAVYPSHRQWLARLEGARLVTIPELAQGAWRSQTLKSLVAGDIQTANYMRRDSFDFTPHAKLIIGGNAKPRIPDSDTGFARRLVLIPAERIPPDQIDKHFDAKLAAERTRVLGWLVQGAMMYLDTGLGPLPDAWKGAAEEYIAAEDRYAAWWDACIVVEEEAFASNAALLASWNAWAGTHHRAVTQISEWVRATDPKGVTSGRRRVAGNANASRGLVGCRIRVENDSPPPPSDDMYEDRYP